MGVEIPPRSTRGLVDSLDDHGLVSGAARQGDSIIQWILRRSQAHMCRGQPGRRPAQDCWPTLRRLTSLFRGRYLKLAETLGCWHTGAIARMIVATAGDVPTCDRRVAEFDWTAERLCVRELGDGWSDPAAQSSRSSAPERGVSGGATTLDWMMRSRNSTSSSTVRSS